MTERGKLTLEWLIWGAILLLFVVDRFIKHSVISLDLAVINTSIALSIPVPLEIIISVTLFILFWLIREMYRVLQKKKYFFGVSLFAILAGGFGNVIDRLYYNGVVDYIKIVYWFPIFNLADVLITLGVVGVGLYYYCQTSERNEK